MYDFVTLPDRSKSSAEKFLNMKKINPNVSDDILPFSVADMDFMPLPELIDGVKNYLDHNVFGYTLIPDSYYETVLSWMKEMHGLHVLREWLVDADNVIAALRQMIYAFTEPADGVIVLTPAYPAFLSSVYATGRRLYSCPMKLKGSKYEPDLDLLEKICKKSDASLLVMCNPHNPVGKVWSENELKQISEICLKHNVFVVSDEIHWDIIMPGVKFTSMASLDEKYINNTAVSTACTKTFNMAALKGASIIMPSAERREKYHKLDGISGRDILSVVMCETAYKTGKVWLNELIETLDDNRRLLKNFFNERIPDAKVIELEGTYLQWIDFRFLNLDAKALEKFMAFNAQCFFTEGYKFGEGGAGFERWNIACPKEVLLKGLLRMEKAVNDFK